MYKLIVVTVLFDWKDILSKSNKIILIDENNIAKYNNGEFKIMPLSVDDYIKYNHYEINIFKNNLDNIDILDNKSKFGKYMLEKFSDNIPITYYYNFDNETFYNYNFTQTEKYIVKPNKNCGGVGIDILFYQKNNTPKNQILLKMKLTMKNQIVQKYINHTEYYCGHFLVLNGIIIEKIYFFSNHKYNNGIKKGRIISYEVMQNLNIDDSIFNKIFYDLNYSGFTNSDFIIDNNKLIIFEINPRPGGSIVHNKKYLNIFLDKLNEII
jgi:predicted ATP-grasp superfamily ATP-dependent carboligase